MNITLPPVYLSDYASTKSRWRPLLLGLSLFVALPIVLLMYSTTFTRYVSDDYCVAAQVEASGVIATHDHFRHNWSGRYTYYLLTAALMAYVPQLMPLVPAALVAALWVALAWLCAEVLRLVRLRLSATASAVVATCILYATLFGAPNLGQSLYWITGAITYLMPLVIIVLYLAATLRMLSLCRAWWQIAIGSVLSALALVGAAGLSETSVVLQIALVALLGVGAAWQPMADKRQALVWLIVGLLACVIGLALVASAPGNAVRQAQFPPPAPLPLVAARTLQDTLAFITAAIVFFAPAQLLCMGWVAGLVGYAGEANVSITRRFTANRLGFIAGILGLTIVISAMMVAPSAYMLSTIPPTRALILPHFVLVGATSLCGFIVGRSLNRSGKPSSKVRIPPILAVMLGLTLIFGPLAGSLTVLSRLPQMQVLASEWDAADRASRQRATENGRPQTAPLSETARITFASLGHGADEMDSCRAAYYAAVAHE